MRRPRHPLPAGYSWRPVDGRKDAFELVLRGRIEVASASRLPDGRWLTRTYLCFAESLQKQATAASPRQARYWLQAWLQVANPRIQRARPDTDGAAYAHAYANRQENR